ncbi:MAG TPA: hypothetical protein DF613_11160 [Lachnospiraceae bacterium]|nr:hypothetical protein [Lachnospiraceae bacterium]
MAESKSVEGRPEFQQMLREEESMNELEQRMLNIKQQKVSEDSVYQFLLFFDKLYTKFNDIEKKLFLKSFVSKVQEMDLDNESTVKPPCAIEERFIYEKIGNNRLWQL